MNNENQQKKKLFIRNILYIVFEKIKYNVNIYLIFYQSIILFILNCTEFPLLYTYILHFVNNLSTAI